MDYDTQQNPGERSNTDGFAKYTNSFAVAIEVRMNPISGVACLLAKYTHSFPNS